MSEGTSVGHKPTGKWEFDESVAKVFEDMLERSIPQYRVMREAVFDVGSNYVERQTPIVDLGSSRGDAIAPFVRKFGAQNRYELVEVSPPMLAVLRERFGSWPEDLMSIRDLDLRTEYPPVVNSSLTLSVLTLQFVPIEYRLGILSRIYDRLRPGGAFILVEKILGASAGLDDLFVRRYLRMKEENGYSKDDIERKRYALEGALVPLTAPFNEELLRGAGFVEVDCFWRWMNFAAWVAVKR